MKRGTPRHPKMYDLASRLGIPLPYAVGIMEMLWHHAAQHTPQGDIGSLPDIAIAEACAFSKKPKVLVDALVGSRWLDIHPTYRLIVHDWPHHCEQAVKKHLDYWEKNFLPVYDISPQNIREKEENSPPSREVMVMATDTAKVKTQKPEVYPGQNSDFEVFWKQYWRKTAKATAFDSFRKLVISKDIFGLVLVAIGVQSPAMLARDPDKRPHASTWLNQRRWEDEPDPQPGRRTAPDTKAAEEKLNQDARPWLDQNPGKTLIDFVDWELQTKEFR